MHSELHHSNRCDPGGVGAHGTPREPYASAIRKINTSGKAVVSIDVPSGLGSEIAVRPPHITVTFTDVKEGMTGENSGKIVVRDIGIPRDAVYRAGPGDMLFYPIRSRSHKGMNGTLSVFGGWSYYGSAVIAARAALAAGCDLVKVYTTRENAPLIASHSFEYMVSSIGDSVPEEAFRSRCILLGPGLGRDFDRRIVSQIIMRAQRIVLDADPPEAPAPSGRPVRQGGRGHAPCIGIQGYEWHGPPRAGERHGVREVAWCRRGLKGRGGHNN
ncbi:hypothetical protein [Thermogymnomonas acidicola]|uniref:NAD(P)H-hydrate dehydratase n=1 Tax=Thermogymnomonas acidicola TaxID=399579 RepID=UPI00094619B2|nr:NAD(P)H-hydrate dehydratase [Thermogymnomonas acidicola]